MRYKVVERLTATLYFDGRLLGLTGANGAGKTSVLRAIAGHLPNGGQLLWEGFDLTPISPYARHRRGVMMVPADDPLFPELTVREYLELLKGMAQISWIDPRTEAASTMGHEEAAFLWRSDRIGDLSGGQRRVLSLLRLLNRPWSLVLLDEPTAGLSPQWKVVVLRMIERVASDAHVLIAEQYSAIDAVRELGARVLELRHGSIGELKG